MIDYSELKRLAENVKALEDDPERQDDYEEAKDELWLHMHCHTILEMIADIDEMKAVFAQPESLTAMPFPEYEGLKRQFFALRTFALSKSKLAGYYSCELLKLRKVDRSHATEEIGAERSVNEQLTNDLLAVEAERDQLKADNRSKNGSLSAFGKQIATLQRAVNNRDKILTTLRSEIEALRAHKPNA